MIYLVLLLIVINCVKSSFLLECPGFLRLGPALLLGAEDWGGVNRKVCALGNGSYLLLLILGMGKTFV